MSRRRVRWQIVAAGAGVLAIGVLAFIAYGGTGTTGTSSSPSTVHDRVPEPGISTGCTSIVSSLNCVMDKAGDNHG